MAWYGLFGRYGKNFLRERRKAQAYQAFLNERAIPDYQSVDGHINDYILERKEGEVTH